MQAVLMVAGKSTRTYPLTLTRPKPLLPLLNKSIIHWNLDQLVGIADEVILIVGYRKQMIEALIGDEYKGMKVIYQEQKQQLGTGHAVLQTKPHIKDRFVVMNGDDLFAREDIEKLLEHPYGALVKHVPDPSIFGVIQTDDNGFLVNFVEKPKEFIGNLANIGCYVYEPEVFTIFEQTKPSIRGEIEMPVLQIARQHRFKVIPITGYWLPTGYPWDLLKNQKQLIDMAAFDEKNEGQLADGVSINGKVSIGKGSIIESGVEITGPVIIGENCKIGSSTKIGPDTCIEDDVQIDAKCMIENSLMLKKSNVGLNSKISYSVIGENVTIGAGCHFISQNSNGKSIQSLVKGNPVDTNLHKLGATIADNVHLGDNTTISPGCKIWPGIKTPLHSNIEHDLIATN